MENFNKKGIREIKFLAMYLKIDLLIDKATSTAGQISNPSEKQAYLELMSCFNKEIDAYTTLIQEKNPSRRKIVSEIWKSRIQKRKDAFERYVRQ